MPDSDLPLVMFGLLGGGRSAGTGEELAAGPAKVCIGNAAVVAVVAPLVAPAVGGEVSPWSTTDADALLAAGWQWCVTNHRWFRAHGSNAWSGACPACRRRVEQEQEAAHRSPEGPQRDLNKPPEAVQGGPRFVS